MNEVKYGIWLKKLSTWGKTSKGDIYLYRTKEDAQKYVDYWFAHRGEIRIFNE